MFPYSRKGSIESSCRSITINHAPFRAFRASVVSHPSTAVASISTSALGSTSDFTSTSAIAG